MDKLLSDNVQDKQQQATSYYANHLERCYDSDDDYNNTLNQRAHAPNSIVHYFKTVAKALPKTDEEITKEAEAIVNAIKQQTEDNKACVGQENHLCITYNYNWNKLNSDQKLDAKDANSYCSRLRNTVKGLLVENGYLKYDDELSKVNLHISQPYNLLTATDKIKHKDIKKYNQNPYGMARNQAFTEAKKIANSIIKDDNITKIEPKDIYYHFIDGFDELGLDLTNGSHTQTSSKVHRIIANGLDHKDEELLPRVALMTAPYKYDLSKFEEAYSGQKQEIELENIKNATCRRLQGKNAYPGEYCLFINGAIADAIIDKNQNLFSYGAAEAMDLSTKMHKVLKGNNSLIENFSTTFCTAQDTEFVTLPGKHVGSISSELASDIQSTKGSSEDEIKSNKQNKVCTEFKLDINKNDTQVKRILNQVDKYHSVFCNIHLDDQSFPIAYNLNLTKTCNEKTGERQHADKDTVMNFNRNNKFDRNDIPMDSIKESISPCHQQINLNKKGGPVAQMNNISRINNNLHLLGKTVDKKISLFKEFESERSNNSLSTFYTK